MCASIAMVTRLGCRQVPARQTAQSPRPTTTALPTSDSPSPTPRVRFAPSPTGQLHLGGLRTALFNFLFARHTGGQFIVRIEDTDRKRLVPGATEGLLEALRWAGLKYDEGPDIKNSSPYGPYIQSERTELYQKYAHELVDRDRAYRCFCSSERLDHLREIQARSGLAPAYDRRCSHLSRAAIDTQLSQGVPYTIRLRFPSPLTTPHLRAVPDLVYGPVPVNPHLTDDAVLLKSDGLPTYHLANVVDDHHMRITHVLRGEEWLSSTAKHMALYEALGWDAPQWVHLPLLLNADGSKLSKRSGDVHVDGLRQAGYLPEALVNYVALLGWSPPLVHAGESANVFSLAELVDAFALENINTSKPTIDYAKLDWLNKLHYRQIWANDAKRRVGFVDQVRHHVQQQYPTK
ncbi:hypothetical protein BJ085DRAFT_42524 [Dimargaris cristalligena]|uniref:Glutamate--tRNA ligase, mitochondrial n=1 Tax=Dimargaris cristalligena TaxID=215637 RepID=A0A4P9ZU40_9FUNG|nr:hypothetical protein BJ085DRAFT_42524 [Dimargaris cristalligena]|eukprot:RKP36361.1 hypothetical protein BJ085DRAFT_42524 [Dimargaris cristalligena]